jgi:hypothetical protein
MLEIIKATQTTAKPWFPHLQWWKWGRILGAVGILNLMISLAMDHIPHPAVVAVLLHALAAGGFPLAVASLATGEPVITIAWAIAGAAGHYAVDWTRKFGMQPIGLGVALDQASHLAMILGITLFS